MSDLIRREDVDKAIRSICDLCGEDKKNYGVMCGACNLDSFIRELDDIPSAEPERKSVKDARCIEQAAKILNRSEGFYSAHGFAFAGIVSIAEMLFVMIFVFALTAAQS